MTFPSCHGIHPSHSRTLELLNQFFRGRFSLGWLFCLSLSLIWLVLCLVKQDHILWWPFCLVTTLLCFLYFVSTRRMMAGALSGPDRPFFACIVYRYRSYDGTCFITRHRHRPSSAFFAHTRRMRVGTLSYPPKSAHSSLSLPLWSSRLLCFDIIWIFRYPLPSLLLRRARWWCIDTSSIFRCPLPSLVHKVHDCKFFNTLRFPLFPALFLSVRVAWRYG